MTHVPSTVTVPDDELPTFDDPDLITGLRVYGRDVEYPLLVKQTRFSVGSSPSCDLCVPSSYVSSVHCVLERRGSRIRVHDQASRNGTSIRGRREANFDIGPGDCFMLATTTLLAINDRMRGARLALSEVLGYRKHSVLDDVLIASVQDDPLLLIGEDARAMSRLVRTIHETSLRRDQALVELSALPATTDEREKFIGRARRGTLSIKLSGQPVDRELVDAVQSGEAHVRIAALAPSLEVSVESLTLDVAARMTRIDVPRLKERRGDIRQLVDRVLDENRASFRMSDLTASNQQVLQTYSWPENLTELRETVTWLAIIVQEGSIRKAAPLLGVPRSTLQYRLDRIGLRLPLTHDEVR
jgi:pSer/pThr/pTyr-binding forkhead associated (FHA) protein